MSVTRGMRLCGRSRCVLCVSEMSMVEGVVVTGAELGDPSCLCCEDSKGLGVNQPGDRREREVRGEG